MRSPTSSNKAICARAFQIRGFSLLELMVTLAIMGILAAIALPQFQKYSQTTRRADAHLALTLEIQNLERCRVTLASYIGCNLTLSESPDEHYALELQNVTSSSYDLVARAQGVQADDTDCSFIAVNSSGERSASSTADTCWSN